MARKSAPKGRIKFEEPPINELVVALFHLPILELKAQHIGLYWDRIRERFPLCEQQPPVASESDQTSFVQAPGELFPLPRFWFSSDERPTLIQIQRNAFLLNWRRLTSVPGEYPHYEAVVQDFWRELKEYSEFVKEVVGGNLDVVQRCELNYVNLIPPNEIFKDVTRMAAALPSLSSLDELAANGRELAGLNATITYRLNPNLSVDLAARLGRRLDTGEHVLGLDLKAHGAPSDLSLEGARKWYETAHDATYRLFLDATGKQMQEKIWKPR